MGTLSADRKTLAVAKAAITTKIHESLDVETNLTSKITLDSHLHAVNDFANLPALVVVKIIAAFAEGNSSCIQNLSRFDATDTVNIGQRNFHALVLGEVNACNTCHEVFYPRVLEY